MNTHSTIRPINSVSVGGDLSLTQRLSSFMNWKTMAIIGASIVFLLVAYFMYKQYASNQTSFHANREHIPKDTNSNKTATMMLFYVDWCPYCKTAKPEWDELKTEYEGKSINGYNLVFVENNCTNETAEVTEMIEKYNIEGYPTIKLLKDNQIIEYDAKPTKTTMVQFLNTVL